MESRDRPPADERPPLREFHLPGTAPRGTSPEISVLTATRGRRDLLLRKQATLARQTIAAERFEWVVLVNGDDDGSGEALRRSDAPFRRVVLESDDPIPVGAARNRAVSPGGPCFANRH